MAKYKKLLIIDDDDTFIIVAKYQLEDLDFAETVIDFPDGEDAIAFFKENDPTEYPEIIILDINMNKMDGWEFLEALKPLDILEKIEIHITSSTIDPADLEKAKLNPYVNSFISKPLNAEKLLEIAGDR